MHSTFATGLVSLALLLGAGAAFAGQESEDFKTVALLGVNASIASVVVSGPGNSADCALGGFITFDATTTLGRIFYATLLSAQNQGSTVKLTYLQNGQTCTLLQVDKF